MPTTTADDSRTVIPTTPPPGWERETPKYRVARETLPAPKARFRTEPPFASASDASTWQYGEKVHLAGEVIETTFWPNAGTMVALNYSAKRVLEYFGSHQKSRLPRSPWADGRIRLEDGMGGAMPKIAGPQVQPMDLRPVRF
jgi:hypothetical protein